eukprot:1642510-Rhodomonas_salina.1
MPHSEQRQPEWWMGKGAWRVLDDNALRVQEVDRVCLRQITGEVVLPYHLIDEVYGHAGAAAYCLIDIVAILRHNPGADAVRNVLVDGSLCFDNAEEKTFADGKDVRFPLLRVHNHGFLLMLLEYCLKVSQEVRLVDLEVIIPVAIKPDKLHIHVRDASK